MKNFQKIGGISSLYMAFAYIFGMIGFLAVANVSGVADPAKKLILIMDNQAFLSILYLLVYLVFSVALVFLSLALYNLFKDRSPVLAQAATVMGIIWASVLIGSGLVYIFGMETVKNLYDTNPVQAGTVWLSIESVSEASGIEFLGGVWVLLISFVALQARKLNKALSYLGVLIGVAGIVSALPGLRDVGMIFGLGQIVWFIWLGVVMLRDNRSMELKQS